MVADQSYYWGTGRRKTAVARVRLIPGTGDFTVNNKPAREYFPGEDEENIALQPLRTTNLLGKFNISVKVDGGGVMGQAGAVCHGIARALVRFDESLRQSLRKAGFLRRDPRMKERKKPGLVRARRAKQYTKR